MKLFIPGVLASDAAADVRLPNPGGMRHLWQERRTSTMAVDQSGVWRFRELLPIVKNFDNVVTLREGNTPLYEMPRARSWWGSTGCWPSTRG